eukprot:scaffold58429_cov56-Cyclotella_meneghiniana.AAC.3
MAMIIASQPSLNRHQHHHHVSVTGGGVSGSYSAAIAVTITAEAEHKCPDDGSGRLLTSGRKDRGQHKAHKDKTNHTTINRDAGGGMRCGKQ